MKSIIVEVLERFKDANLASEAAREKIASEILKAQIVSRLLKKIGNNAIRPLTGQDATQPAGTLPSGTGRNFIQFDSKDI